MSILLSLKEIDTNLLGTHINVLTNLINDPKVIKNDEAVLVALQDAVAIFSTIITNHRGLPLYVRKQVNYGIEKFYPVDEIGAAILVLTGKKLFTKEDMRACKSLGFNIELAPEELNLDDTELELKAKAKLKFRKPRGSRKLTVGDTQSSAYQATLFTDNTESEDAQVVA